MCYAVYLGTEIELKTSKWDENKPAFYIEEINTQEDSSVLQHFSKPKVYYLGSHEGCGCGFAYDEQNDDKDDDLALRILSVKHFINLLEYILNQSDKVEIFLCWEGEQGTMPRKSLPKNIEYFKNGNWVEDKPTFYNVIR